MENFGMLLRRFRKRCHDPSNPDWVLSQAYLGELLGEGGKAGFSGAAISDWERGVSKIHADQRLILLKLVGILSQFGGITSIDEANSLLHAGNYRALDPLEAKNLSLPSIIAPTENSVALLELWPPGIPDEDYFFLPQREQQVTSLVKLMEKKGGPALISIDGLGGMGKTAMAAELVRRCVRKGLFHAVIGESAKQEMLTESEIFPLQSATLSYQGLLEALTRQLQLWDLFTRDEKTQEAALSRILRNSPHLVFVDNLETAENANELVARLRNILGISRAVITSRIKLGVGFSHSYTLDGLSMEDAAVFIQSLAERLDVKQIQNAQPKTYTEMWQLTGGSPLAIKLAVAQARFVELDYILRLMREANTDLYFFIFKESWKQLSEVARSILVYIGKTVIETVDFQELLGVGLADNEGILASSLEQLINYSLVDTYYANNEIRYSIHQLTRQFIVRDLPMIWKEQGLI